MIRQETAAVPACSIQLNLQGSSQSGNTTIVGGNLIQNIQNTVLSPPAASTMPEVDLERILEWLAPNVNFRSIHIENFEKCAEGTLSWFLEGDNYRGWKLGEHKIIWGTGIPGAGKTVLASRVINDLESTNTPNKKTCILYAYCRYTEALTVKDILEGLIKECLERHSDPELVGAIVPILERHRREKTRPPFNELMDLLRIIERHFDIVFYIIDGLDEARVSTQFNLIKAINSLAGRFSITSRPLQTLEDDLHSAVFYPVCARREDITRLIQAKISQHSHLRRLLKLNQWEERVVSEILDKSGGMFIHAALQVEALGLCRSSRDLEDVLNHLPLSLEDMYRQTTQRIQAQPTSQADLGIRALLWVVFSQQPLHIEDVLYAVATDPETHVLDEERMVDQGELTSACCGLIEVDDFLRVRLVHYTAQEALKTILLEYHPRPHAMIVQALMQRLISLGLPQSNLQDLKELQTVLQVPLGDYAYHHWQSHLHTACKVK
ncbi:hypothetical protein CC1G_12386 [Coprinopsis cinerea okayama7|uniref:Uncharacterized protein n=1 Tax=Coprinopsis cinerea (strain Okayama-7 / 130 / ATCC MYA-4618 / FGSC 9003) TaxID=240176 RepID=A8NLS7_COPC7|nr:hypothetical protein CC1G_12386 [Coprinopsis cinerea okayama7\|eukprot:XP_001834766.2 hypothetical protein CC1G_12386 [Coprinopsis cinerea okayama7\